jgi:hypothetical protein
LGDGTRKSEDFTVQISYRQEYVEEEDPKGGLEYPVQSPKSFIKASISGNNRVLSFLVITSVVCLGALVLAPVPIVQAAAAAIWHGSLKFAQRMLNNVNR